MRRADLFGSSFITFCCACLTLINDVERFYVVDKGFPIKGDHSAGDNRTATPDKEQLSSVLTDLEVAVRAGNLPGYKFEPFDGDRKRAGRCLSSWTTRSGWRTANRTAKAVPFPPLGARWAFCECFISSTGAGRVSGAPLVGDLHFVEVLTSRAGLSFAGRVCQRRRTSQLFSGLSPVWLAGRSEYVWRYLVWGRMRSPGSDHPGVGRVQGETLARGDSHRAGLTVALCKVLDNLLGTGTECAVHVKRERAELESTFPGRQAVEDQWRVDVQLAPRKVGRLPLFGSGGGCPDVLHGAEERW
jgi:hypothetical protein